jgi:hypothetical protein
MGASGLLKKVDSVEAFIHVQLACDNHCEVREEQHLKVGIDKSYQIQMKKDLERRVIVDNYNYAKCA